jgi:hypothetical protein
MRQATNFISGITSLLFALSLTGCADKPKPTEEEAPAKAKSPIEVIGNNYLPSVGRVNPSNDFHTFYQLYQIYLNDSGQPLTKLEDLKAMNLDREASKIYQGFMEGRYAFNFSAGKHLRGETVLCYEKDVTRKGGTIVVLMGDGSVQTMTAPQLQAALKASGG